MITVAETADWLKERNNFLIITHRRPDGDTIGCAGALARALSERGKTAYVLHNPDITPRYESFVSAHWAPDGYVAEHVIAVDTASFDLFAKNANQYKDSVSLCIDHHSSNTQYADFSCLDGDRATCGEIVFDILIAMSGSVSKVSAERLYVALSTDTGCFAFGNTTANTLFVASLLVEAGAPNKELSKTLFRTKTRSRIKMEGMLDAGIEYSFDGKVAIATITRAMIESSEAVEDDLDDIAAIPGSIEGVFIGITIREMSSTHDCKISVRTQAPYNAHTICGHFGGGGHTSAAGSSLEKTVDEIKEALHEVLVGYIN
jgi:phosphoesterase RecJ-like protein